MNAINPESTVLHQIEGKWQQFAALILWKLAGTDTVKITGDDIERFRLAFEPETPVIFTFGYSDSIDFQIVSETRAKEIAEHDATIRGKA